MKPWLTSDPGLREVLQELRGREPIFHRPELGAARADFEAATAPGFWEVGASGRASIWRRCAEGWKILFHQGTVVEDDTSE